MSSDSGRAREKHRYFSAARMERESLCESVSERLRICDGRECGKRTSMRSKARKMNRKGITWQDKEFRRQCRAVEES